MERKFCNLPISGNLFFHTLEHSVNSTHLGEKVKEFYKINFF